MTANLNFTQLEIGRPSVLAVDGQTLIFAGGNTIKWLDLQNGRELHAMSGGTNAIGSWSMAENQPAMIAYYADGIKTLSSMGKLVPGAASVLDSWRATALSWDGALAASGAFGGSNDVKLWDVKTGSRVGPDLPVGERIAGLAFSPDAKYLVCGTARKRRQVGALQRGSVAAPSRWVYLCPSVVSLFPCANNSSRTSRNPCSVSSEAA